MGFKYKVSAYASCCGARTVHEFRQNYGEGFNTETKPLPQALDDYILTAVTNPEHQSEPMAWLKKNGFKVTKRLKSGTTGATLSFWIRAPKRWRPRY